MTQTDANKVKGSGASGGFAVPRVDVVIVNWNTGLYLRSCLESIAAVERSRFELGSVVVVDNASTDGSLEGLVDLPLPLRVVRNAVNRGFAVACNQGAKEGDGEFILFLNPDTRLFPESLARAVAFMTLPSNACVGICGGRVMGEADAEELSCSRFPTLWMVVAKMTGLATAFPRWVPRQRIEPSELQASQPVDQVIGACLLIRRTLFETLGGFDERFFVYMEDVDLAYRARRQGYSSHYLADVSVYHAGNVSSDQVRGKRLFYLLRARTQYARKHWPRSQAALLAGATLLVELPVRALVAAAHGSLHELESVGEAAWRYVRYVAGGDVT